MKKHQLIFVAISFLLVACSKPSAHDSANGGSNRVLVDSRKPNENDSVLRSQNRNDLQAAIYTEDNQKRITLEVNGTTGLIMIACDYPQSNINYLDIARSVTTFIETAPIISHETFMASINLENCKVGAD